MNRKSIFRNALVFFVVLCLKVDYTQAQSIARQSINASGSSSYVDGFIFRQTIGQPYATRVSDEGKRTVRPGFQQPAYFKIQNIESSLEMDILVYPNPATSMLYLKSTSVIPDGMLTITDIQGNIIVSRKFDQDQTLQVPCNLWVNGIYFLKISNGNTKSFTSKIIIAN
ncbi:MAG: T9SS type A sorting domain-containing protein [Cyclobacteriaceae bacterium]|nr:T9SS type A sorting domain-containing protein [Cyclobacteriaceae bacterium]